MELKDIEWDSLNNDRIYEVLSSIPTKWPKIELPKLSTIDRAVGCQDKEIVNNAKRLSFCPFKHMSKSQKSEYQRCNLPGQEMFYGSLMPSEYDKIEQARIISLCESSKLIRNKEQGHERFIFGLWELQDPLHCLVIIDDQNKYNAEILSGAQNAVRQHKMEFTENQRYIAKQFYGKANTNKEYRLCAIYANYILSKNEIDAIIYPSTQTASDGACIAIKPHAIDSGKLKLIKALDTIGRMENTYQLEIVGRFFPDKNDNLVYEPIKA